MSSYMYENMAGNKGKHRPPVQTHHHQSQPPPATMPLSAVAPTPKPPATPAAVTAQCNHHPPLHGCYRSFLLTHPPPHRAALALAALQGEGSFLIRGASKVFVCGRFLVVIWAAGDWLPAAVCSLFVAWGSSTQLRGGWHQGRGDAPLYRISAQQENTKGKQK